MTIRTLLCTAAAALCTAAQASKPSYDRAIDSCLTCLAQGDTARFERLCADLPDLYEEHVDPASTALRRQLVALRNRDQGIRLLLLEAMRRSGDDSSLVDTLRGRMRRIDRDNALRVRQIIDRHGWPGREEVGEEANEALFLCLQHVDDTIVQEKYLPVLRQAVAEGRAEGWHLAFLTDRIRMNRGEKQIYGTQTVTRGGQLDYVVPIEEPERVDSLRRSIGLKPMARYLDGAWDLERYLRELPEIERKYAQYVARRRNATR
ncbi:DUF6624 domain-containing protein [uncultured Alistipes sp.]|uniref:DUF6624 domain-containing protein n=1 Tax=uncultured Alistipes sp. TaxID=538949 RepID=UPI0025CC4F0D|nr:DUF6624 domain-containing protein [uncultured Alistipes sp.]